MVLRDLGAGHPGSREESEDAPKSNNRATPSKAARLIYPDARVDKSLGGGGGGPDPGIPS